MYIVAFKCDMLKCCINKCSLARFLPVCLRGEFFLEQLRLASLRIYAKRDKRVIAVRLGSKVIPSIHQSCVSFSEKC